MQKKVQIMVVDDDPDVREFLDTLLTKEGYEVKSIADPALVLEELKNKVYQIIILDLRMPGQFGDELLKQIRDWDKDICVIIYTGYPSVDTAVATMKCQAYDYIKKPCSAKEFREIIRNAIRDKGLVMAPDSHVNKEIGTKIRTIRKDKAMTLKQLANRTGLSVSLISQIELAKTSASVSTLYKISCALGVRIGVFFEQL